MTDRLPYPPPWMDMNTLCAHICTAPNTVDNWVAAGILPAPRKRGNKLMWRWIEVDEYLANGKPGTGPDAEAERIRDGTRRAAAEGRSNH